MRIDETPPAPLPEADPEIGRITTSLSEKIFYIGIDRPTKLNGFTPEMFQQIAQICKFGLDFVSHCLKRYKV